jgi:hypothetical protein
MRSTAPVTALAVIELVAFGPPVGRVLPDARGAQA